MAGAEKEPGQFPPQHVVQVYRDRVVAPPARFMACSDEALLTHFQELFAGDGGDGGEQQVDQLAALFALLEGVTQHEFLALRRRLEADFAVFSAASQGVHLGAGPGGGAARGGGGGGGAAGLHDGRGGAKRLLRLSSIEDHERRFLRDFMSAMHSSHYRLLGLMEWEAAQAEAFLFTLPVEVEWSALDKRMLQRYWGDRPEQRAALPDLSDRILIFCRGFEPAKMRGRYLMQKVEMLLSFYLLAPLWAGVARMLQQLGLRAPAPPVIARTPQKPDITFKRAMKTAQAAVKWRRAAAQGSGGAAAAEDSLTVLHDACTIIERKTMNRHFPTGRSVLSRFFDVIELQEACIRDVVVLYRRKAPKGGQQQQAGEKEILREGADPAASARNIQIRQFAGIPLADLEMVMPEKKVFVPGSVFLQLLVAAVAALVGLLATFWQASLDWKVWGSALMLLASRASQVYFQASSERNEIEREMNKLLFERTVAAQEPVLHTLTEEMSRQHIRECFLCYCCLLHTGKDMRDDDLDVRCERMLRKNFDLRLDFTTENAIPPLCEWGMVARLPDGRLRAAPLQAALVALDKVWDSAFNFDPPAGNPPAGSGTSSSCGGRGQAGSSPGGAASISGLAGVVPQDAEEEEGVGRWLRAHFMGRRLPLACHGSLGRRRSLNRRGYASRHDRDAGRESPTQASLSAATAGAAGDEPDVGPAAATAAAAFAAAEGDLRLDFFLAAVREEEASEGGRPSAASKAGATAGPQQLLAQLTAPALRWPVGSSKAAGVGLPADAAEAGWGREACIPVVMAGAAVEGQVVDDALSVEGRGGEEETSEEPSGALEPSSGSSIPAQQDAPAAACRHTSSSSSDSSLEASPVTLRVPWSRTAPSAAGLLRISPQQLRHLESLRRQRVQQEAEGLECLPSALLEKRLAGAGAAEGPGEQHLRQQEHGAEAGVVAMSDAAAQRPHAAVAAQQQGDEAAKGSRARRVLSAGRRLSPARRPGSAGVRVRSPCGRRASP